MAERTQYQPGRWLPEGMVYVGRDRHGVGRFGTPFVVGRPASVPTRARPATDPDGSGIPPQVAVTVPRTGDFRSRAGRGEMGKGAVHPSAADVAGTAPLGVLPPAPTPPPVSRAPTCRSPRTCGQQRPPPPAAIAQPRRPSRRRYDHVAAQRHTLGLSQRSRARPRRVHPNRRDRVRGWWHRAPRGTRRGRRRDPTNQLPRRDARQQLGTDTRLRRLDLDCPLTTATGLSPQRPPTPPHQTSLPTTSLGGSRTGSTNEPPDRPSKSRGKRIAHAANNRYDSRAPPPARPARPCGRIGPTSRASSLRSSAPPARDEPRPRGFTTLPAPRTPPMRDEPEAPGRSCFLA